MTPTIPSEPQKEEGIGTAHTPGPWRVIETHYLPHDGDHVADMSNGLMVVALCRLGDPLADARLIAAAPELLELVRMANDGIRGTHTVAWQNAARAAIAKATGSSNHG